MMIESPENPAPNGVCQTLFGGYWTWPVSPIWRSPGNGAHMAPSSARFNRGYGAV